MSGGDAAGAERLSAAVLRVWQRNRPVVADRLELLEEAAGAGAGCDAALREAAATAVHKLAGSLGMYGMPRSAEIAQGMEAAGGVPSPAQVAGLRAAIAVEEPGRA